MRFEIYLAFFLLFVCFLSSAEAGPFRRLAGVLRGGKAAVGKVLPPYGGRSGGCARPKLFGR